MRQHINQSCLALLLSAWALSGHAAEPGLRQDAGAIRSAYTGWTYPLRVYLPAGYAASKQRYPVLYTLDGEFRFDLVTERLDELGAEVIVVAIGATSNARREIDFVIPGALAYSQFLTEELIPWADANYRTDPAERALAGHSLAGLLCALMFLFEDPEQRYFNSFLISDASFWDKPEKTRQLIESLRVTTASVPVTLFIAAGAKGNAATKGNLEGTRMFHSLMQDSNFTDLDMRYEVYATNHKDVIDPSFRDGLAYLYAE
jgi:predicted alpha/beta superfamily hydrolase